MNILTDSIKRDSGEVTLDGQDILKMGAKYRALLGYMPQYPGMYPNFTADEFLHYMATLKGVGDDLKKADKTALTNKQIDGLFEAVELSDVRSHRISSYSGGMKQRLALASAAVGEPEILLLDEPTAELDPKQRISIRNFISSCAMNRIVIIATHIVSDVEYTAKQAIILKKGVKIACGAPHELAAQVDGRVFSITVPAERASELQSRYRVINIQTDDDGVSIRLLSDTQPDGAKPVAPSLEDYYLYTFSETQG